MSGWWPVALEEAEVAQSDGSTLQALYEDCEVHPSDLDGLSLRLERATDADIAKYGEGEDDGASAAVALRGTEFRGNAAESGAARHALAGESYPGAPVESRGVLVGRLFLGLVLGLLEVARWDRDCYGEAEPWGSAWW
jgi:hypothetical protein